MNTASRTAATTEGLSTRPAAHRRPVGDSIRRLFRNPSGRTLLLIVILAAVLTHTTYVRNGFSWLDHYDVENGLAIVPIRHIQTAFTKRLAETGFYRPVFSIVHSIDHAVYGDWAPGYHLTNIALHAAVVAAAFLFAGVFFRFELRERTIAALVVAVHPLSWLPTGSIAYRSELLVTLFTLLAVSLHIRSRLGGRRADQALTVAALLLGVLSKETAAAWIPALIVLWEISQVRTGDPQQDRLASKTRGPFPLWFAEAIALTAYALLRHHAVPEVWRASSHDLPILDAIGTRLAAFGKAVVELVIPFLPPLSDATRVVSAFHPSALLSAALIAAGIGIVLKFDVGSSWGKIVSFGGIMLAPTLNLIPLPRFTAPHYSYAAVVGVGALVALILRHTAGHARRAATLAIAAWIGIMAVSTILGGPRFSDDFALFAPEVSRDPNFLEGHFYLGNFFFQNQQYEKAAEEYTAALAEPRGVLAFVNRTTVFVNFAGLRLAQGRPNDADELLRRASEGGTKQLQLQLLYNRALIAAKNEDDARVVELIGSEEDWRSATPLLLYAQSLWRLGRGTEAVAVLRRALQEPDASGREPLIEALIQQYGQTQYGPQP